jgi:DUF1365 family protein
MARSADRRGAGKRGASLVTARLPDLATADECRRAATIGPGLVAGSVGHRRTRPAAHEFSYPAFCLRLPLSRLAALADSGIRLNRAGLVSFHECDHGPRDGTPLAAWIADLLSREGIRAGGEVVLYAFPRMLGYAFNPVSFWVCHDPAGAVRAVLVEVNNTFGETHHYLLAHADGRALASGETLTAGKIFHVSPFCAVRGHYTFRFNFGPGRWLARIDYFDAHHDDEGALLETYVSGTSEALPTHTARALFWRYRWFTLGVIARIHWQALRLWVKRVPHFARPQPPESNLSRSS